MTYTILTMRGGARAAYREAFGEVRAVPENALLLLLIAFLVGEGSPPHLFQVPGEEARPGACFGVT